jgi:TatD DNase family protein
MQFIDTHSHLYLKEFESDINEVLDRARKEEISKIILPNIDSSSITSLHDLTNRYPDLCIPLMGLHPTNVKGNFEKELELIFNQLDKFSYKGIGEIGIDLYWDKTYKEEQMAAFKMQLNYALKKNLPVVIHARDSFREILDIVKVSEYTGLKGIFHAFTGNNLLAMEIIGLGFKLGIGGIVTFKNSGLAEVIRNINLEHLVLETDSPYLAPVPFRGKRNESSYVRLVAEKIAQVMGKSLEEVAEVTTRNAKEIFSL